MVRVAFVLTLSLGLLLTLGAGCSKNDSSGKPALIVFVAASVTEVTREFGNEFTRNTGVEVDMSVAASGILRRQIEAGAPCDVFISADAIDMDLLAKKQGIDSESRRVLASNQLVVVALSGKQKWESAQPLEDHSLKIAIGDPRYVPAGRYAKDALEESKLWDALEGRLILADNVRVALQYVESRQADVAIVYSTDALTAECEVLYRFPETSIRIECHGATCARSTNKQNANAFLSLMTDRKRADNWKRHGFLTTEDD